MMFEIYVITVITSYILIAIIMLGVSLKIGNIPLEELKKIHDCCDRGGLAILLSAFWPVTIPLLLIAGLFYLIVRYIIIKFLFVSILRVPMHKPFPDEGGVLEHLVSTEQNTVSKLSTDIEPIHSRFELMDVE